MRALTTSTIVCVLLLAGSARQAMSQSATTKESESAQEKTMQLGVFSVSLAVKDIKASKAFYEKLDFQAVGGDMKQNWIILQNGTTTIGLFQGMFEKNIMTFNPGWNHKQETLENFDDVRDLQAKMKERGLKLDTEVGTASKGPGSVVLVDPDGNSILFDQHVASPE